jgi:hypothetical protein
MVHFELERVHRGVEVHLVVSMRTSNSEASFRLTLLRKCIKII